MKTGIKRKIERVKVKPAKGLTVLDNMGNVIPEKGIEVVYNTFYSRLVKSGDLELTTTKKRGA